MVDQYFQKEVWNFAGGSKLSTYAIALEAWRRGLNVTFQDGQLNKYTIGGDRLLSFVRMRIDTQLTNKARKICKNKDLTKEYLSRASVPVPEGKRFYAYNTDQEIIQYAKQLRFPVVLKPNYGSRGRGVVTNIRDAAALADYLVHVRRDLNFPDVMIEKQITGEDYRLNVVGKKVVRAVKRVPANITGDGKSSVQQLIDNKNYEKQKHPFLSKNPIKIDPEVLSNLKNAGYNLQSVPGNGELIFLKGKSNISAGGDLIKVVVDELPAAIKNMAVKAVKAIPGLDYSGVDLLFDGSKESNQQVVVIELNSTALVGLELFDEHPTCDLANAIVDLYFPESCKDRSRNSNLFFNLSSALRPLQDGSASAVTIAPAPSGQVVSKKLEISGLVKGVNFVKWAREKAIKLNLSGYLQFIGNSNLVIIVAGNEEDVEKFETLCQRGPKKALIDKVTVKPWDKMVMAGFTVKKKKKQIKTSPLKPYLKKLKKYFKLVKRRLQFNIKV